MMMMMMMMKEQLQIEPDRYGIAQILSDTED